MPLARSSGTLGFKRLDLGVSMVIGMWEGKMAALEEELPTVVLKIN